MTADIQRGVDWPVARFIDNNDGTVTDSLSGLIWLKNANCYGSKEWSQALIDVRAISNGQCGLVDGSKPGDWHLPNRKELYSLLDFSTYYPSLPAGHPFINVENSYWSSTNYLGVTSQAWAINLNDGGSTFSSPKHNVFPFWPIRNTTSEPQWAYPILPYVPGSYAGRSFFYDSNQLGEDINLAEKTPIHAIGPGVIKKYSRAQGYVELVAVVEHNLGIFYDFTNAYGDVVTTRYILSIYGHLRKCKERGDNSMCTGLKVGDQVTPETVIGYVNNSSHPDRVPPDPNGDGLEHLHMGIRLSDATTAQARDPKAWFRGYEGRTTFGTDFAAASEVIEILMHQ